MNKAEQETTYKHHLRLEKKPVSTSHFTATTRAGEIDCVWGSAGFLSCSYLYGLNLRGGLLCLLSSIFRPRFRRITGSAENDLVGTESEDPSGEILFGGIHRSFDTSTGASSASRKQPGLQSWSTSLCGGTLISDI